MVDPIGLSDSAVIIRNDKSSTKNNTQRKTTNADSSTTRSRCSEDLTRQSQDQSEQAEADASRQGLPRASTIAVTGTSGSPDHSGSNARARDRGYSLRRTLFASNIHKRDAGHGTALELQPSSSSQAQALETQRKSKDSVRINAVEEELHDDHVTHEYKVRPLEARSSTVQQSDTGRRTGKLDLLEVLGARFEALQERILHTAPLPPTIDGRHVTVNVHKDFSPKDERTGHPYISNKIRSCKYNAWNFLPKQLFAQFGKLANFYFLCVSILQMIPGLSTTGTYTTIVPLLIFVSISMAKEGYDDLRRNKLDKEENERKVLVLDACATSQPEMAQTVVRADSGLWRNVQWQGVRVGDVVLIERDASVPADVVLLHASGEEGIAYIETKSLDGETNLKIKKPLSELSERCQQERGLSTLRNDFVVEDPNLDLYKFDGKVSIDSKLLPLTNEEVLYRGSVLRNTQAAAGLVVYTGEECKIRMNANKNPRVKAPTLQAKVNRVVILVASLVVFIAVIESVGYLIWRPATETKSWYLEEAAVPFGQIFTSFIIMFNTMLPLSLYVSLEIVKVAQMFMMNDIDIYDAETDTPLEAHTSTINEELGQVNYIFSDKTGTLTNNSMKFRKMSIAGTAWLHDADLVDDAGKDSKVIKLWHKKRGRKGKSKARSQRAEAEPSRSPARSPFAPSGPGDTRTSLGGLSAPLRTTKMNFNHTGKTEELLEYIYGRPQSIFAHKVRFFLLSLALCHTCTPEKDDDGEIHYQGSSPDELALVSAAQELGYIVTDRQRNSVTVKTFVDGDEDVPQYETYQILDVIEFSSLRKRMSIIIQLPDSRICLFCKGADSTIRQLLRLADLANAQASEVQRRASVRKSLEAQAAIRRRSTQISRPSMSASLMPHAIHMVGRQSSVSVDRKHSIRQSVDVWLKDREGSLDQSAPRRSSAYYTRRASQAAHASSHRASLAPNDSPRTSFQADDVDGIVDEAIVIDEHAVFERCFNHIDDFATEGLRTLMYGHRFLTSEEYNTWKILYNAAATNIVDRQREIEAVAEQIERQLELTGATAIEDKLQKGVPDAIERFTRAGIKLWMLTGDKRETALNIGQSCRLIKDYSTITILDREQNDLVERMRVSTAEMNSKKVAHSVLVVDGQTLSFLDTEPHLSSAFAELAIMADSVVCCRASPSQKAGLVKMIRTQVKGSVTLAIGDGANDIAMIQEAHLGIGIAGKEGLQAARVSDYSIGQFRFLLKLLLVHGRWNYVRICKYTLGTFWKEMIFYLVQAIYQRWTGYTGTSLYEPWSLSMFNTLFTSLPVIFIGVFEKDLSPATLLAVPELYSIGQLNQGFNIFKYVWWAILGAVEAVIIYFLMYSIYGSAVFTRDNQLFAFGVLGYTACVTLISLKLQFFELHNKTIMAGVAVFLSVGGWWLWNLILSAIYDKYNNIYTVHGGLLHKFGVNPLWWLTLILIVLAISALEFILKALKFTLRPSDVDIFQRYERDLQIRKRFEESAADLLQQGWQSGTKKSSLDLAREEAEQARREAEIQDILDRPRTMDSRGADPQVGIRKRNSWQPVELEEVQQRPAQSQQNHAPVVRKSLDIGELFSRGYGIVRKESMK